MTGVLVATGAAIVVAMLLRRRTKLRAGEPSARCTMQMLSASALISSATLIDGANEIPVALSLNAGRVRYESANVAASIDVRDINHVEYGSDLMTGGIAGGAMLRFRSHGRAFAFVLDMAAAERWSRSLPPQ